MKAKPNKPVREPLTKERIVDKALEILDAEGVEGISMRRLGYALGVEAGKRGQERGMDIQDPVRVGLEKRGRDDAHEAREADEVHIVFLHFPREQGVIFVPLSPVSLCAHVYSRDGMFARPFEGVGIRLVADHDGDFRGQAAVPDVINDRLEV